VLPPTADWREREPPSQWVSREQTGALAMAVTAGIGAAFGKRIV